MKLLNLTFLLTLLLSMTSLSMSAHDIQVVNDDGVTIYYTYINGQSELEVSYQGSSYSAYSNEYTGKLVIPDEVTYNGVTRKVTRIGDYAFRGCSNLVSVVIPNNVTAIGTYAFYGCSLKSIIIGPSVLSIGSSAFSNHPTKTIWLTNTPPSNYSNAQGTVNFVANDQYTSLSNRTVYPFLSSIFVVNGIIYVPVSPSDRTCDAIDCIYDSSAENVHIGSTIVNQGISLTVNKIKNYACYRNPFIKDVQLSNNGLIGDYAFSGCTSVTKVVLNNTDYIGQNAFSGITSQFTANINNHGYIGSGAFYNSTGLKTLEIGSNVTNINSEAFEGCSGLTSATINNHGAINQEAFYNCSSMQTAVLGENVTSIGGSAFSGCSSLQSITIPNAVSSLGTYAFSGCSGIQSVRIGTGVKTIPERAFSGCSALTDMQIGDSVNVIGSYAFNACSSLPVIRIPQSVLNIYSYAFSGCTSLHDIYMDDRTIVDTGLQLGSWTSTNTASSSTSSNTYTFSYKNGDELSFDFWVSSESGCDKLIVTLDGTTILTKSGEQSGTYTNKFTATGTATLIVKYTKDSGVNSGSDQAKVSNIKVTYDGSLHLASNGSSPIFSSCPLDSVYIGRNISYNTSSSYGYSPFYRNTSLRSVKITDKETEVSENEFYGCTNLKNVSIGNGVTTIGNWAFSGCSSLDYFAFGSSVTSIGKEAFSDCTAVTRIIGRAATPPTCGSQALDDINKWTCTLQVPAGGTEAYKAASQWKEFFYIVEEDVSNQWFKLIYKVDGETYKSYDLRYGASITPEPAPTKEGYTFSGWSTIPSTMPATDVTIVGTFRVNSYKLTYELNGEVYKVVDVQYGSIINPEEAPTMDGYTFSGWSELPSTMPAHDVTVSGSLIKTVMEDGDRIDVPNSNGVTIYYVFINNGTELAVTFCGDTYNSYLNEYVGSIVIPESVIYQEQTYQVTAIADNAFRLCTNLSSVTLPRTIRSIGVSAFSGCTALMSITSDATTPPACGVQAFESVDKTNCKVYVPEGTSIAYKAADGWKEFASLSSDGGELGDPTANILVITDVVYNRTGDVVLPIQLNNRNQITGLQMDLYLPTGVTVATNARGKVIINVSDRMEGTYTITANTMTENGGFVRILGYSPDGDAFTGNSGVFFNITLNVDNSVADGTHTITIKDIILSDVNNKEYHPANVSGSLTVKSFTPGDVDNSGAVNINDVVCIINYILNRTNGTFVSEAADVDGNGTININDVVTLINRFILHRNSAPKRAPQLMTAGSEITDHLYLDNLSIKPGETLEIAMKMANANEVRAVQGNVKLPAGLKFVDKGNGRLDVKNLDERSEDFTLSCALQEDGSMTFAHYSADGFAYEGHEGGIFTFKVTAEETAAPGDYEIDLTDVVLSINGVGYEMPDLASQVAIMNSDGIKSMDNGQLKMDNAIIYNIAGQRLYKPQRGVNIVDGKKVAVK